MSSTGVYGTQDPAYITQDDLDQVSAKLKDYDFLFIFKKYEC